MSVHFVQCSFDDLPVEIAKTFSCTVEVSGCGKTDRRRSHNVMKVVSSDMEYRMFITQFPDGWYKLEGYGV